MTTRIAEAIIILSTIGLAYGGPANPTIFFAQQPAIETYKLINEARKQLFQGQYDETIQKTSEIIQKLANVPHSNTKNKFIAETHLIAGLAFFMKKDLALTKLHFDAAISIDPQFVVDKKKYGQAFSRLYIEITHPAYPPDFAQPRNGVKTESFSEPQFLENKMERSSPRNKPFSIGLNGGYSKIISENGNYWSGGFYIESDLLFKAANSLYPGLMISYHSYAPDETAIAQKVDPNGYYDISVSGSGSYFEIMPVIQFSAISQPNSDLFFRFGFGINFMNLDALARVFIFSVPIKESATRPSVVFGFGFNLGNREGLKFEMISQFHLTFIEGGTSSFITAGLGIRY
jgi:hypothetical protein